MSNTNSTEDPSAKGNAELSTEELLAQQEVLRLTEEEEEEAQVSLLTKTAFPSPPTSYPSVYRTSGSSSTQVNNVSDQRVNNVTVIEIANTIKRKTRSNEASEPFKRPLGMEQQELQPDCEFTKIWSFWFALGMFNNQK